MEPRRENPDPSGSWEEFVRQLEFAAKENELLENAKKITARIETRCCSLLQSWLEKGIAHLANSNSREPEQLSTSGR
jgi:hypothetical protein